MDGDSRLAQLAHSARWFLFAKTSNDRRRATYWRALAGLHRVQMRRRRSSLDRLHSPAVDIPASRGFATCAPGHIDGVDAVIDEVRRMRAQFPLGDERPYLLDQRLARLDPSSPLLRFALHPGVVAAAARYLGVVPKLAGVTILASPHVPRPFSGSQLFHSDWEDVRQVKVFVHCSDVTDASGPLTAVVADASRRVKQEVGYVYGGDHFRLTDDEVLPRVSEAEVVRFTGPAGSATFLDTSACLHMGSRVEAGAGERLVVQFQYLTPAAFDLVLKRPYRPTGQAQRTDAVDRLVLA